jgi:hypothetical protein
MLAPKTSELRVNAVAQEAVQSRSSFAAGLVRLAHTPSHEHP